MSKPKYLWLAVTPDEFEHPIYIEDTARELGEKLGVSKGTIMRLEFQKSDGRISGRKVVKIPND